jgi:alkylation response protein AidB-like acyl-CoA dehydrogenase
VFPPVDFELSEDQQALAGAAAALLDDRCPPARVRAVMDGPDGVDRELWAAMVDQGWCALEVPEPEGGLGLGPVEAAVLAEAVGAHVAPVPFTDALLVVAAARAGGADGTAAAVLAGQALPAAVWCEDPTAVRAVRDGAGWRLDGRADPTPLAPVADVFAVPASGPDGPALHLVEAEVAGPALRADRQPGLDPTRAIGWVELDGAPSVRLGGAETLAAYRDRGATFVAAELLGAARRVLERSVAYAGERVQFGRPIGSFQAVKHRLADALVDVEGMRSAAWWAAWCCAADPAERPVAAAVAKSWCGDAARRVTASGLQVHGGIGFTWEHDLHLYLKRARVDQERFGDATWWRRRLAGLLRDRVEAGRSVL